MAAPGIEPAHQRATQIAEAGDGETSQDGSRASYPIGIAPGDSVYQPACYTRRQGAGHIVAFGGKPVARTDQAGHLGLGEASA